MGDLPEIEAKINDFTRKTYGGLGEVRRAVLRERLVDLVGVKEAHRILGTPPS